MAARKLSEITQGTPGASDFLVGVTAANQDRLFPVPSVGGGVTINTTSIFGGTSGDILYDNAGTVGEMSMFSNLAGSPNASKAYYMQGRPAIFLIPSTAANWFEAGAGNFTLSGFANLGTGDGALAVLTSGSNNTAIGQSALGNATTAVNNTAIGENALGSTVDGSNNVAIGQGALGSLLSDQEHVAIGYQALLKVTSVGVNSGNVPCVAIGNQALLQNLTGYGNIAIGQSALQDCTGIYNTAIGASAFENLASGNDNTGIGVGTAQFMTSGSDNVAIGLACGQNWGNGSSNNVWLGSRFTGAIAVVNSTFAVALTTSPIIDYNLSAANQWTFSAGGLNTPGLMTTNASGTVSIANSAPAATVPANFSATNRIQLNIGGTTYYIAADTVAW